MRNVSGTLLLASGIVIGVLLADRWSTDPPGVASAAPQIATPGSAGAGSLPDLTNVATRAVAAAANIAARTTTANPMSRDPLFDFFFGGRVPSTIQSESLGSGVIVSDDGYILTNQHVVGDSRAEVSVTLPDNRELPGRVVGVDELTDLAVIKVDATGLTPLPWGNSDQLALAEWVLAVGNPFALDHSVSLGIVSAVGRASPTLSPYTSFIQTDAAINPGNSGGALVNGRGELIGINNAIASRTGGYQGVSFAIPANLARRVMAELIEHREVRWGSFDGVSVQGLTSALARRVGTDSTVGVVVVQMWDDSAAYAAGLRPGDLILSFNDQPVMDYSQFARLLADATPGTTARLGITRRTRGGEDSLTFTVPVVSVGGRR